MQGKWFLALQEEVIDRTHDVQAQAVLETLKEHSITAMPVEDGVLFLSDVKSEKGILFIPIVDSDRKHDLWKPFLEADSVAAHFIPEQRALIVKDNVKMSAVFKGILLAHEGQHAKNFIDHPYEQQSDKEYCEEERDVHEFQDRLTLALGGNEYEALLKGEVKRLHDGLQKAKQKVGHAIVPRREYHDEMDKIFGPALSDREKSMRETWLWINANFRMIDTYGKGNVAIKENSKGLFLCSLYKKSDILKR